MVKRAAQSSKNLKRKLEHAEGGDVKSAKELNQAEVSAPEKAEAVEQEAADGPPGRGLSR
jgi:hypothetical protein